MIDSVNHPAHYTAGSVEVIDILEQAAAVAPDPVVGGLQCPDTQLARVRWENLRRRWREVVA